MVTCSLTAPEFVGAQFPEAQFVEVGVEGLVLAIDGTIPFLGFLGDANNARSAGAVK